MQAIHRKTIDFFSIFKYTMTHRVGELVFLRSDHRERVNIAHMADPIGTVRGGTTGAVHLAGRMA